MTTGIYAIYWPHNDNAVYVGQSVNLEKRRLHHLWSLKNIQHRNIRLQRMYNKYGEPEFVILEVCKLAELLEKEVYWVSEFDSINLGYNLCYPEASKKGYLGTNSKYSKLELLLLFRMLRNPLLSNKDISELTGIAKGTVIQVASGDKHKWLHETYPNISKQVTLAREFRLKSKYNREGKIYYVKDSHGNVYSFSNQSDFCRKHNLPIANFNNVLHGRQNLCKGFSLLETFV